MFKGLIARLLGFVVLPALIAAGAGLWHLHQSLPRTSGRIAVPVGAPVAITRDAHGVPHIVARSDRDAFFAIGFVHAQDRMWQLEVQRRIANGRLSEIFGRQSIEHDVWFRTLGLARAARSAWTALSPEAQQSLQAYTDGINAWLAQERTLPVEFTMFGITPEPWTVYDSLAWSKVFALDLGGNYSREIERLLLARIASPDQFRALVPEGAGATSALAVIEESAGWNAIGRLARFNKSLEADLQIGGRYIGSNAWAVAGRLTADGAALLANDPHLGLQIPSPWYMASIQGHRLDVAGATLVGLPVVVFGRNEQIAWGGTSLMGDAQDLFFEQVEPDDSSRYRVDDRWEPFTRRTEIIKVKQDFPATLRNPLRPLEISVRISRHGPIISDAFGVLDHPAALRWTALDPGDTSYDAFFNLNYATGWSSFRRALADHVAPALNFVYADRRGNIGYLAAGRIPVRKNGEGALPVPGWTDEYEWTGFVPPEDLPSGWNPPSGYVVSANNNPVGPKYPYFISHDFASSARANRITALLEEAKRNDRPIDLDVLQRIQADQYSEPARRLWTTLLEREPEGKLQEDAYGYLRAWDGSMGGDRQAATIFNVWVRHLKRRLLGDELAVYWNNAADRRYTQPFVDHLEIDLLNRLLSEDDHGLCDDRATAAVAETCQAVMSTSLDRAIRELRKIQGDDMDAWAWGQVHETLYRHTPFSGIKGLRNLFQRKVPNGGSPETVNVANFELHNATYVQDFGPSFRQLMSMAPEGVRHRYMNSTGQSGNVASEHYDDMVERFGNVTFLSFDSRAGAETRTLHLVPASEAITGGRQ